MPLGSYEHMKQVATDNANQSGAAWCVFSDTSGNWHCEPYRGQTLRSWSGVRRELVMPQEIKQRFIYVAKPDDESFEILDILDFTTPGDDADPVKIASVYDGFFAMGITSMLNRAFDTHKKGESLGDIREPGQ